MLEQQEPNQEIKTGRDLRQTNVSDQGQYAKRDINNEDNHSEATISVQGSDAGETVVNNGGTHSQTNIDKLICLEPDLLGNIIASLTEGFALTDPQRIESVKAFLGAKISKLPVDSDKRKQLRALIANSEFDSIAARLKSSGVLARYLAEEECRISLAKFMAYGCRQQIINLRSVEYFQDNCNNLAKWLCYCLEWIQHYCRYLRPKKISDKSREVLQGYSRAAFDEAFAVLEFYLTRNCMDSELIGDSELNELRECTKLLYQKIGFD